MANKLVRVGVRTPWIWALVGIVAVASFNSAFSASTMDGKPTIVRGKVVFGGPAPSELPSPSFLVVKLSDVSRMDAPAEELDRVIKQVDLEYNSPNEATRSNAMEFQLQLTPAQRADLGTRSTIALSATLNLGYEPVGGEWIRKGDYLNDTANRVTFTVGEHEVNQNIVVIHYI